MNRRIFVRNAALGTAGLAGGFSALFSSCSGRKSSGLLNLALIGCGNRGVELAMHAGKSGLNTKIKYLCDVNSEKSKQAASKLQQTLGYLPATEKDYQTILNDKEVDAVIIATPNHWHALATIKSLQAGKDVYVDATPSLSIWEGKKMQETAKKNKRIVQVGYHHRSASYVNSARDYIVKGKLGQVVHVKVFSMNGGNAWEEEPKSAVPEGLDWSAWLGPSAEKEFSAGIYDVNVRGGWTNYWAYSGGALSGRAGHLLDIARNIMSDPNHPNSVYCWGGNQCHGSKQEVPEMQVVTWHYDKFTLTCETGNSMNYMKNKLGADYPDWMRTSDHVEVYGTKGLMYIGLDGRGWQVINKGEVTMADDKGSEPTEAHVQNFLACVRSGNEPVAAIKQGNVSAALTHLGNIAYRVGNRQLAFDKQKEVFPGNDDANQLLTTNYREGFKISDKI